MNETELHNYYLKKCAELQIKQLKEIRLDKVFYIELLNVIKYTQKNSIVNLVKRLVKTLGFKPDIEFHIQGKGLLCLTVKYNRTDHDIYWERIKKLFDDRDEIILYSKVHKTCFRKILKNIFVYIGLYKKFDFIDVKHSRIYLTCCLLECVLYKELLDTLKVSPKVVISFFDSEMLGNLTIQYLRKKGTVSVTNQHGQPVYRGYDIDHLSQSQILNLTADYFVAKGQFTKKQFIKAGFEGDRIKVLGGFGAGQIKKIPNTQSIMGVFLDCPYLSFANQSNKRLIETANRLCDEMGYKYFVKTHPTDKKDRYYGLINDDYCIEVIDKGVSLEKLIASMELGLLHASAVYVDIIINGCKAYKLESEESYPLVESREDRFKTYNELLEKLAQWKDKNDNQKKEYLLEQKKRYVWDDGFENRYRDFIQTLKAEL